MGNIYNTKPIPNAGHTKRIYDSFHEVLDQIAKSFSYWDIV